MRAIESVRRTRPLTLVVAMAALFITAGGFVHLTEWLDLYRHVPANSPGADVVRLGFPLDAAASLILAIALPLVIWHRSRLTRPVIFAAIAFQAASLAMLIATRVGTVFGWTEPTWTPGAEQSRALEAAALVALLALAALVRGGSGRASELATMPGFAVGSSVGAVRL